MHIDNDDNIIFLMMIQVTKQIKEIIFSADIHLSYLGLLTTTAAATTTTTATSNDLPVNNMEDGGEKSKVFEIKLFYLHQSLFPIHQPNCSLSLFLSPSIYL